MDKSFYLFNIILYRYNSIIKVKRDLNTLYNVNSIFPYTSLITQANDLSCGAGIKLGRISNAKWWPAVIKLFYIISNA